MRTVRKKILIVDDIYSFIQREKTLLSRKDFKLLTVTSGHEALFRARYDRPDLIILHLYMPDMNGDAVCRELKSDSTSKLIPLLLITAQDDEEHCELAVEAGCDGCIAKPIHRENIVPAVEKHLGIPPRKHLRTRTSIPCSVTDEDGKREATILNLTPEGALIKAEPPLWAGDIVMVDLSPGVGDQQMSLQVAVRWASETSETHTSGAGCEFLAAPPEILEWIDDQTASPPEAVEDETA